MKARDKNALTKGLIEELNEKGLKTPAWKAVAKGLNRPRRQSYEVSLSRLEKHAKKGESVVVPGTVLGTGELSKPVTVAALRFSGTAREKIEKAGGKAMTIEGMVKDNPGAKKLRIMG
jgi:large subunit ribosomal protein L18e